MSRPGWTLCGTGVPWRGRTLFSVRVSTPLFLSLLELSPVSFSDLFVVPPYSFGVDRVLPTTTP